MVHAHARVPLPPPFRTSALSIWSVAAPRAADRCKSVPPAPRLREAGPLWPAIAAPLESGVPRIGGPSSLQSCFFLSSPRQASSGALQLRALPLPFPRSLSFDRGT
eukprot:13297880-Alexandrium_andersonii.AAC.1